MIVLSLARHHLLIFSHLDEILLEVQEYTLNDLQQSNHFVHLPHIEKIPELSHHFLKIHFLRK
jgi:hypothetical protein